MTRTRHAAWVLLLVPGCGPDRQPLIGLIDELRLMKVARTAAQICADAGKQLPVTTAHMLDER
jgi:hypothetical protein